MIRRLGETTPFLATACALTSGLALAQIPYPSSPSWTSSDTRIGTGCALVDLDRDGWQDLVVANGNDIDRQRVTVYTNDGNGSFPSTPSWSSSDVDYHGHLSVGDVNGDGWPDLAVSVFLGAGGFSQEGHVKLYLNDGTGTLSSAPVWTSQDTFYTFSLALGDADGDGDLDLAVATGEPYFHGPDVNRIYTNHGGTLSSTPSWTSTEADHSMDVAWGDMNGDGALDLVFCNAGSPQRIYYSSGGTIEATAGWSASSPASPNGNSLSLADLDGDGYRDLVFSDNNQLGGGSGRFLAYFGGAGGMAATPGWQSENVGYVSGVVACDVQGDGIVDVIGGSWWGAVRMYLNSGGGLSTTADYASSTGSVVEALPLGDADKLGLAVAVGEAHAGNGQRKVFYTDRAPLLSLDGVVVDGVPLAPSQYCYEAEAGWISLSVAPASEVLLDYAYTTSADFAVSNWDSNVGNYLFLREPLGASYCGPAELNSSGFPAEIVATGSRTASVDDLHLSALHLPSGQFGYFLTSETQGFVQHPGGSQGNLCLAGSIGRFSKQVQSSGPEGRFTIRVDLKSLPTSPPHAVLPGETWNFQAWFRDVNPTSTSNFTDATEVTFD